MMISEDIRLCLEGLVNAAQIHVGISYSSLLTETKAATTKN